MDDLIQRMMEQVQSTDALLARLAVEQAAEELQAFLHSIRVCLTIIAVACASTAASHWAQIIINLVKSKESHDAPQTATREESR